MKKPHFRKHAFTQRQECFLSVWEGTIPIMTFSGLQDSTGIFIPGLQKSLGEFMIFPESWTDENIQENLWLRVSNF